MKASALMLSTVNLVDNVSKVAAITTRDLNSMFHGEGSNAEIGLQDDAHKAMVNFLVTQALNAKYKKAFDKAKNDLDTAAIALGVPYEGVAGSNLRIFESNEFTFRKKRNQDGATTLLTDFVIALARIGVEKSVIDAAMKTATKPKRGNVYYEVIGTE